MAIQRTQESNGGRGYQRSFIEQQEKSEHQRRVLDTLREKRHNMIKYGEFVKHYAKDSNKSMEYKAKPTTSAFQLIERERKRSMEMVKRNREMGNNFMKEGNKIARVQLSMSPVLRKRKEPEEEVDPYEVRKKEARAKYSNLHDIFKRDKQIEGYHLDHGGDFGRIANVKKIDNFTSHASQSMAIDMIKQIDIDLLRKERESTVQNRELLDNEFMKSIQAKIDVLNNRIPQKNLKKSPELRQSADPKKNRDVVLERIKSANKTNKQKLKERPMKLESLEAVQKKKNEQNPLVKIGKKEDDVLKKKEEDKKAKMIGKLAKLPNRSQEEKKQIQNQEKTDPKVEETNFILEEKGSEQTGKKDGKTLVPKDDPYIKGLSRDLDQDPSESMSASHQNKLKKDLGDFFDKNHEDDGKDNEF